MAVDTLSHSLTHTHMYTLVARFYTGSSATETIIAETHTRSHTLQHLTNACAPQGASQLSCLQLLRGETLTYTKTYEYMHMCVSRTCTGGSATIMAATAVDLPRWLANRQTMVIAHIRTTHAHTSHARTQTCIQHTTRADIDTRKYTCLNARLHTHTYDHSCSVHAYIDRHNRSKMQSTT